MKHTILFFLLFVTFSLCGQSYFEDPVTGWSMKKESIINLKSGEQIKGKVRKLKVKKGLVKEVVLKIGDEKKSIPAADIANMYIAQNSLSKVATGFAEAKKLENYLNKNIFSEQESELLKEGYTYYESHFTEYRKGKELDVLLIVLNPFFNDKIVVFHDPIAQETTSVGVEGMKVGGQAKSYFIKKGDGKVYRIKKKDFKKSVDELFDGCAKAEGDKGYSWLRFDKHIFYYTTECE